MLYLCRQKINQIKYMKKRFALMVLAWSTIIAAWAGGLMTNTNYHIAFDRMMARGATFDIDAAYSNPAGLAWGHEGWQLSLNFQKPWQKRDIKANIAGLGEQTFEGVASAPIVPALFASYKHDRWALSTMIGIVGSGGFVKYDDGVPMFNLLMQNMLAQSNLKPGQYALDSEMKGKQYIYGAQLNFTYRLADCLSAAVGLRANYYDGYYRGHVRADHAQLGTIANLELDVDQTGWGFTPLFSVDYHQGALTLTARYEFRTKVNTENKTNVLNVPEAAQSYSAAYQDGVKTRYDMPALLSVAAGYAFTDKLRATLEYHFFDDKNAKMSGNRQDELEHGTHEILAGVEYDINRRFTVSCGAQRTDYGLTDGYQQDTSFACDSYSIGLGGAWNISDKLRLNAGYFITLYSDYEKPTSYGSETFSRTNNVIGLGIDYKF